MYGKLFAQMYDGTLGTRGPWQALITFQQFIILADKMGTVDMTAEALARRTTIPLEIIEIGIAELERIDPESRTPDEDGRRIVRVSETRPWGWRIVNYEKYRKIRTAEERREYQREYWHRRKSSREEPDTLNPNSTQLNNSTETQPTQPIAVSSKHRHKQKALTTTTAPARNWLSPFVDIWNQAFENGAGTAVAARLGKALKPLRAKHSDKHITQQLRAYLEEIDPLYANPQSFAQKFGKWNGNVAAEAQRRFIAKGTK